MCVGHCDDSEKNLTPFHTVPSMRTETENEQTLDLLQGVPLCMLDETKTPRARSAIENIMLYATLPVKVCATD